MKMRFGLGVLAYLVPTFALGFVWHLVLFKDYYEHLAVYRKDIIIPFGLLSMLVQAFMFAWVYQFTFAQRNGGAPPRYRVRPLAAKLGAARDGLTVIPGDVHNADAMSRALAGHDAVLSALGPPGPGRNTITSDSARATIAAMQSAGIDRLLVVGVAALFPDIGVFGHLLRNTLLRYIADDSAEMERIVKASGLDWTNDRLPNGGGGNATISRADVAHFILAFRRKWLRRHLRYLLRKASAS
jgi:hypothetical protein